MSGLFLRTFLTATAIAAFAAGPAAATGITVDGSISDWQALGLVHTDNIAAPLGYLQITAYGATVQNGTFYAFVQTSPGVSGFLYAWPGAWINADQNAGTQLGGLPLSGLAGTDLVVERDMDIWEPGLNYWGAQRQRGLSAQCGKRRAVCPSGQCLRVVRPGQRDHRRAGRYRQRRHQRLDLERVSCRRRHAGRQQRVWL